MVRLPTRLRLDEAIRTYASAPRLNSDPERYRHGFAPEIQWAMRTEQASGVPSMWRVAPPRIISRNRLWA